MADDELVTGRKHRTSPDYGDEEELKRWKHGHRLHRHSSSSSNHYNRNNRRHNSKHEAEAVALAPFMVVPSSNLHPEDDKEEGEILEEEEYTSVGDVESGEFKNRAESEVESGEFKLDEAVDGKSDSLDPAIHLVEDSLFVKAQEELVLNLNLSPEDSRGKIAGSSKKSRENRINDDGLVMISEEGATDKARYQLGDVKKVNSEDDIVIDSRTDRLVVNGKKYEMGGSDGSSAEFELPKSKKKKKKKKKEKRRGCDMFPRDSILADNGDIGHRFGRKEKRLLMKSGSPLRESGEDMNDRDAEACDSKRRVRSRSPVASEDADSRKHRKRDYGEGKVTSFRNVEQPNLVRYELEGPLESMDVDRNDLENQEKLRSAEVKRDNYRTLGRAPAHDRCSDEAHHRKRSKSRDHARGSRSRSRSVLRAEALVETVHYQEQDSDLYTHRNDRAKWSDSIDKATDYLEFERVVRSNRNDLHGGRDWVRNKERDHFTSYSRYDTGEGRQSRQDTWDRDRVKRERDRDADEGRHRDRDRTRAIERRMDTDRDKDYRRERESERYRNRGKEKESDKITRHHKYGSHEDGYGGWNRDKDSRHLKHDQMEYHHGRARSKERAKNPNYSDYSMGRGKDDLKRDENEQEDYQERVALQLAEQEEEEVDRIKEESKKRSQAILEKYKQQQLQQNNKPYFETGEAENPTEQPCLTNATAIAVPNILEVEHECTDVYADDKSFSVGKSPPPNGILAFEETSGAGGLGDGTPKSERSVDMFCDDIFGESPAGTRKTGKGDGLQVERGGLHDNWDDAEGYYSYRFGEVLDGRYEIIAAHGKGVFSTVVRAKDLKTGKSDPEEVAIKMIRNNETMYKAGMEELIILKKLAGADPEDRRHCVRFFSSFKYRNHLCLVFESLHMNLREILKKFGRNIGLKLTAVRAYAKQLFLALKHLKNCGVLHCDIKPDNMLVNEAKNVLKLCDFGNAMFAGKNEITPYLVSRFYRAPEIILGLPYDHPMDIWSVGCCLYELYTGKVLFPGPSNNDMLRLQMELKGSFPKKMLRKGAFTDQHFDHGLNFHATEEDPVTKKIIKRLLLNIKPKDIGTIITGSSGEDPKMLANFKDILERIFMLDPEKRMTVSQALSHPFITDK